MRLIHDDKELEVLALLKDVQQALNMAANSLAQTVILPKSRGAQYLQPMAVFISRCADGYIVLREAYRTDASKLLVRPLLEALFCAAAVVKEPGFLVTRANEEFRRERALFPNNPDGVQMQQFLDDLEKRVITENPGCNTAKGITVRETAKLAGMEDVYNTHYRFYCRSTHVFLGAIHGPQEDHIDTLAVVHFVMQMLELLKEHTPASVPVLDPLKERLAGAMPR